MVSIGLALLKAARVETWEGPVDSLRAGDQAASRLDGIDLTCADLELLDTHLDLLGLIRVNPGRRGRGYTVTVAICDQCGRWTLSAGTGPRQAHLRLRGDNGEGDTGQAPEARRAGCCPAGPGN